MRKFKYVAMMSSGDIVSGEIEGQSMEMVARKLKKDDLTVIEVNQESVTHGILVRLYKSIRKILAVEERISDRTIILFTRQFSTLLEAGINILQSLRSIMIVEEDRKFKSVLAGIIIALREGNSISAALGKYPHVFSQVYTGIVKVGETSGKLPNAFTTIAHDLEKSYSFKQKTISILTYPTAVLIFSLIIILLMFIYFVPSFTGIYNNAHLDLPLVTVVVIKIGKCVISPLFWLYAFLALSLITFLLQNYVRTPVGRHHYDFLKLKLPIVGELLCKGFLHQFFLNLACMLEHGVFINDALVKARGLSDNVILNGHLEQVYVKVKEGNELSEALKPGWFVPRYVIDFIRTGEATGALTDMLRKSSEMIEQELLQRVETLLSMFEPVIISILSVVIGFIIIATFLPLYGLIRALSM